MTNRLNKTLRMVWRMACLGIAAGLIALPHAATAAQASPSFPIDAAAHPEKETPGVATDAAGNVISLYSVSNGTTIRHGVTSSFPSTLYVVRHNAAGAQIGQVQVVDDQTEAGGSAIAADAAGNFTVVWTHLGGYNGPFYTTLRGQRFDASGSRRGLEFSVATDLIGTADPSVAMNATGEVVVGWDYFFFVPLGFGLGAPERGTSEIHVRRFAPSGLPRGGEIVVRRNVYDNRVRPNGRVGGPVIAINPAGAFAVSWQEDAVRGSAFMARRYSAAGAALGESFLVDTAPFGLQGNALGLDAAGNLLLAWTDAGVVETRRYDSAGIAAGPRLAVTAAGEIGERPIVLMNPSGDAAVAWNQRESGSEHSSVFGHLVAQRFDASGVRFGPVFQVDDAATDLVTAIAGAPNGSSGFVFAYILSTHAADGFFAETAGDLYAARCCTP